MSIWPRTARPALSVGGVGLAEIAEKYGTPVYVVDEGHVRARCREYRKAMGSHEVVYAASAFWCRAMARWIAEEDLSVSICSEGQLVVARAVGFPPERILMHANGRTLGELSSAIDYGVNRFVIDARDECAQLAAATDRPLHVLLRVTPDLEPHVHQGAATVSESPQFGFSFASATAAAEDIRVFSLVELAGVYCDLGSQVSGIEQYETAARRLVALTAKLGGVAELNLGGGPALPHEPGAEGPGIAEFAQRIGGVVRRACSAYDIPVPRLTVEPGSAIVGPAGLTLCRVLTLERGPHPVVVVDGGVGDGPQLVPPGGRHFERVGAPTGVRAEPVTVVGGDWEAGRVVVSDALLPSDIRPGDLLAVPCTGASHHVLASNYNLQARPPVIAVRDGRARPVIRRETGEDVLRRDVG